MRLIFSRGLAKMNQPEMLTLLHLTAWFPVLLTFFASVYVSTLCRWKAWNGLQFCCNSSYGNYIIQHSCCSQFLHVCQCPMVMFLSGKKARNGLVYFTMMQKSKSEILPLPLIWLLETCSFLLGSLCAVNILITPLHTQTMLDAPRCIWRQEGLWFLWSVLHLVGR